jgi:predicted extracellular nuclease
MSPARPRVPAFRRKVLELAAPLLVVAMPYVVPTTAGAAPPPVVINEVDSDTPGTDALEFVEIYDGGVGNTSLTGLVVVFFNGSNDASYAAFDLDGASTDANGYFTLGNTAVTGVDLVFAGNLLQNGADAVALYQANGSDFPNNTPVTMTNLLDAIVYDTDDPDDVGLLPVLLNPGEPQVNENAGGDGAGDSNSRCPDGSGGPRNTSAYRARTPTPDGANDCGGVFIPHTIPEIQGTGPASPLVGINVSTTGIVTALKQEFITGSYVTNGFFLQSDVPDSDGNPNTSEGLSVFTSSPPAVAVGDLVSVAGTVAEFFQMTRLNSSNADIAVLSAANPLPAPVMLTSVILSPAGPPDQLERLEGMRVAAGPLTTVAATNTFGEIDTVLQGVARPFREPGINVSDPLPPAAPCCVPRFDENPERLMLDVDGRPGATIPALTAGVTVDPMQGPLDFSFGRYKVVPDAALAASPNATASPVPAPLPDELTVASSNLLNFSNASPDFAGRVAKASLAIRTVMQSPDVIGVEEVIDLATLQALADRLNTDTVGGGGANPAYVAYLIEGNGTDPDIDVGFLVKSARVNFVSVTQEGKDAVYTNPITGLPELLNDRPPLVLRANALPAAPGNAFTVVVNHLRSLIDVDQDPGEGPRVRAKRRAQAEFLANLLQSMQAENVVSVGDYNAFQFNDGYVDGMGTVKGQPAPIDQVTLASPDLVTPDLTNLVETAHVAQEQRYSYVFEGNAQTLDHVLVNANLWPRVTRFRYARNNADFPATYAADFGRPERMSDHDMPVVYLSLFPSDLIFADGFEGP